MNQIITPPSLIAGIDIGGTKIAVTLANAHGILHKAQAPVCTQGESTAIATQAYEMVSKACAAIGAPFNSVTALGVSTCSPFVRVYDGQGQSHLEVSAPNLCGGMGSNPYGLNNRWKSFPLQSVLEARFPQVEVQNDAVATLQAERLFGAAKGSDDCVYGTWSTGIGFGVCVDGRLLRGKRGNAGHAGHSYFAENEAAVCGCGNTGDMEALLSGHALAKQWQNMSQHSQASTADLFQAAYAGNPLAIDCVDTAAMRFGAALYNLAVTLDTQLFVLGGSVFSHHQAYLMPRIERSLKRGMPALTADIELRAAALGELTADLGALSLVMPDAWLASFKI